AISINTVAKHRFDLAGRESGVDCSGIDTPFFEILNLIFHECNEGRNYYTDALFDQSRNLKADRLSSSRGEQCQGVFPFQNGEDNILLQLPETVVTPII